MVALRLSKLRVAGSIPVSRFMALVWKSLFAMAEHAERLSPAARWGPGHIERGIWS